ncbi:DEAD/DEAH box helicase [Phenylobacterium immobile]|uniref:DEAD/DEAH box helicase n=1 Tax=Phenylobacterium immobile TaxID=21 RepID=UPI000A7EC313|nr:DEAD/DEAH box helicase [Phenylobacterium immobile]
MPFPNTHPALAQALKAQGYEEPTAVQAAILDTPRGADLLVSAQTGSGKTVAFGLAAGADLLGDAERFGPADAPVALVVAPTRELALQVSRELGWLYAPAGARIVTCVGGMDARSEQRALNAGCHVVVGTPGRLRDHLERGNLDLASLKIVVLDEADEMLDLGFREDLEEILDATPPERRTLLFSATIAREIATLARRYQRDAVRIDTVRRDEPHGDIEYRAVRVAPNEIEHAVVNLLRYFDAPSALIFCATREAVRHLYGTLRERGFQAVALSGELSQKERTDALQALRDGHARACVATDVAARGLDLPALDLVIHADLPQNKPTLLHRSGRTGRAGRKGTSIVLAPYTRQRKVEQLFASAQITAYWSGPPTADEVRKRDQERLLDSAVLKEPASEEDLALGRRLLEGSDAETIAASLVRLYRSQLPEPEDVFDGGGENGPRAPRAGPRERPERGADRVYDPRAEREARPTGGAWFRIPVGRVDKADPKWLIPLICRHGHVTKRDIGEIRIFPDETLFEISTEADARFRAAVQRTADGDAPITPVDGPAPSRGPAPKRPGPNRAGPKLGGHKPGGPHPGGPRKPPTGRAGPPPYKKKRDKA